MVVFCIGKREASSNMTMEGGELGRENRDTRTVKGDIRPENNGKVSISPKWWRAIPPN
jgi:hypothetical protein